MDNFTIFGLQAGLTFLSFYLIVKYYLWPKIVRVPVNRALQALVATNIFRHLGLVFLVPQVVSPTVPRSWTEPVAYGDLIAVLLAIAAFWALAERKSWARSLVWIFNIVGFADLLMAYIRGVLSQAWTFEFGSAWYITTFLAPVFLIIHVMIFRLLLRE